MTNTTDIQIPTGAPSWAMRIRASVRVSAAVQVTAADLNRTSLAARWMR